MYGSVVDIESLTRPCGVILRIGLAIAGVMAAFNTVNGLGSLIDPSFGQTDPTLAPQPAG